MAPPKLYSLFIPEIKAYLDAADYATLKKILSTIPIIELAQGWQEFNEKQRLLLFYLLTANQAIQVFEELDTADQEFILQNIGEKFAQWVNGVPPETLAKYFPPLGERFLKSLRAQARKQRIASVIPKHDGWPSNTAGALMKRECFCVEPDLKARQTLDRLQATVRLRNVGELYALYVTDKEGHLLGILSLRTLIAAPPDSKITDIMWPVGVLKIHPEMDQEEIAKIFRKYDLTSIPVVNQENKLLGIVVIDDVLDVLHQEATEDIAKMAGTQPAELTKKKIFDVMLLRMPWLVITCFGQFLAAHVIKNFETTLSQFIALASFMPFIAAMGGNVGTQSSTITVRALATGEWSATDLRMALLRDACIGLLLGVFYGCVAALLAFMLYGQRFGSFFPLVVAIGMTTSMSLSATLGVTAPFIFNRFNIDPATATGPLVTTVTDLLSVSIYLLVASLLLF